MFNADNLCTKLARSQFCALRTVYAGAPPW